jgi:hypothetical protein
MRMNRDSQASADRELDARRLERRKQGAKLVDEVQHAAEASAAASGPP